MSAVTNPQEVTVSLTDDTAFGVNLDVPHMDDVYEPSGETYNSSEEFLAEQTDNDESVVVDLWHLLATQSMVHTSDNSDSASECCSGDGTHTVPRTAGNFTNEVNEFIPGMRLYVNNILAIELSADMERSFRQIVSAWNTFLQPEQGVRGTSAIISSDINKDINKFILWLEEQLDVQWSEGDNAWIQEWLQRWNMFLQTRAGKAPVIRFNLCLTIVGFLLYIVDLGSDIATAINFASNAKWWQAIVTLAIVYGAVIIHTAVKWQRNQIQCIGTGTADWLRYVASLLVNWPDVKLYWELCVLEWHVLKTPTKNAHLVLEWNMTRGNVSRLKFTEGICEACPQAILQLCLLVPDLYGAWTWTEFFRIAGASVSLCTAGAALVNWEKFMRIINCIDLPLSELVVLHVWAVPVTVSRLLSVTLFLSVHLYWALAGVALHLVLRGVYWCRTRGVPRELYNVIDMCLDTLQFFLSPFAVYYSIKYRRVFHAIHFLGNTAMMVVWALGTPLVCAHPALRTAIICFHAVMFAVGLVGWQLHEKHWLGRFPWYNN